MKSDNDADLRMTSGSLLVYSIQANANSRFPKFLSNRMATKSVETLDGALIVPLKSIKLTVMSKV